MWEVFGSPYSSKVGEPTVQGKRIHKGPSNNPSNLQKRVSSKPRLKFPYIVAHGKMTKTQPPS